MKKLDAFLANNRRCIDEAITENRLLFAFNNFDFAFVTTSCSPNVEAYDSIRLLLYQSEILSDTSCSLVGPLIAGEISVTAVWQNGEQSNYKKAFAVDYNYVFIIIEICNTSYFTYRIIL